MRGAVRQKDLSVRSSHPSCVETGAYDCRSGGRGEFADPVFGRNVHINPKSGVERI